jgi:hypothetical protein
MKNSAQWHSKYRGQNTEGDPYGKCVPEFWVREDSKSLWKILDFVKTGTSL